MAGDGVTDEEAIAFWAAAKVNFGSKFPKAIKETCEIVIIGGALFLASMFTESAVLTALYWVLLFSFGCRISTNIGFPKAYDSPSLPFMAGLVIALALTGVEHIAIKSAADSALIQMQGDRALKLLEAREHRDAEDQRLFGELAKNNCFDDEAAVFKKVDAARCRQLRDEQERNARSANLIGSP